MKSKGHILFFDAYEYFRRDGHIYKALKSNPIQIDGHRHGRWEGYDRQQTLDYLERIAAIAEYKKEEEVQC